MIAPDMSPRFWRWGLLAAAPVAVCPWQLGARKSRRGSVAKDGGRIEGSEGDRDGQRSDGG